MYKVGCERGGGGGLFKRAGTCWRLTRTTSVDRCTSVSRNPEDVLKNGCGFEFRQDVANQAFCFSNPPPQTNTRAPPSPRPRWATSCAWTARSWAWTTAPAPSSRAGSEATSACWWTRVRRGRDRPCFHSLWQIGLPACLLVSVMPRQAQGAACQSRPSIVFRRDPAPPSPPHQGLGLHLLASSTAPCCAAAAQAPPPLPPSWSTTPRRPSTICIASARRTSGRSTRRWGHARGWEGVDGNAHWAWSSLGRGGSVKEQSRVACVLPALSS